MRHHGGYQFIIQRFMGYSNRYPNTKHLRQTSNKEDSKDKANVGFGASYARNYSQLMIVWKNHQVLTSKHHYTQGCSSDLGNRYQEIDIRVGWSQQGKPLKR